MKQRMWGIENDAKHQKNIMCVTSTNKRQNSKIDFISSKR